MITRLFRFLFTLLGCGFGFGAFALFKARLATNGVWPTGFEDLQGNEVYFQIGTAIFFGIIFFRLSPLLRRQGNKVATGIEKDLRGVPADDLVAGCFGLVVGLVIAYLISNIYSLLNIPYVSVILTILTYILFAYLGVIIVGKRGKEIRPALIDAKKATDVNANTKRKGKGLNACPKILDTSVIIDGRIYDILKTGFLEGNIVIPEFVLLELQHIADSSDGLKRNRGRRGLDVLNKIQAEFGIEIYNAKQEKSLDEIPEVDIKLLKLAQIMNGKVVTNDFNLNKVAAIQGVDVLNINELANTLKPVVLPGEDMTVFLVKEGKENNQGVAYLDDGTMIVVEEGRKYIGQTITTLVTSVLQTSAGRMIFAKPKGTR